MVLLKLLHFRIDMECDEVAAQMHEPVYDVLVKELLLARQFLVQRVRLNAFEDLRRLQEGAVVSMYLAASLLFLFFAMVDSAGWCLSRSLAEVLRQVHEPVEAELIDLAISVQAERQRHLSYLIMMQNQALQFLQIANLARYDSYLVVI